MPILFSLGRVPQTALLLPMLPRQTTSRSGARPKISSVFWIHCRTTTSSLPKSTPRPGLPMCQLPSAWPALETGARHKA
eukprot:2968405-Rhodomonas_salina.1